MINGAQLKDVLARLPVEAPTVRVLSEGNRLLATVTSTSFEGVDEAERQQQVWQHINDQLGEDGLVQIEFVFTNAPSEEDSAAE